MAEISAFLYGWALGVAAVVIWILYGTDALPHLTRYANSMLACIPCMAHFAEKRTAHKSHRRENDGRSAPLQYSHIDGAAADQGLEGLTGSTGSTQPITVTSTCMMSRYGSDGTIGPPIECLLSLESNMVTVYELLRLSDSSPGSAADVSRGRSSVGAALGEAHGDSRAFRNASGATVVERRRGKVCVLSTTVMEVRQLNGRRKSVAVAADPLPSSASGRAGSDGVSDRRDETPSDSSASAKRSKISQGNAKAGATAAGASEATGVNALFGGSSADSLFTGRVLIWRTLDGRPLFDSSTPPVPLHESGGSSGSYTERLSFSTPLSASHLNSLAVARAARSSPATESLDGRSVHSSLDADDGDESTVTEGAGDGASAARYQQWLRYGRSRQQRRSILNDMANWSCVIIKFERSRETDRWHTLLSGLKEAQAWHDYAKSMPNPDTINMFLSRFVFQNMRLDGLSDALIAQIRKKLRDLPAKKFPRDLGGEILLDDFLIGTQIPWISDVSEPRVSANGEVGFDFNLFYKGGEGGFSLFFRLALTYCGVRIPHVVFTVKLLELEATMHVSIGPPPSKIFWIGAHKPPIIRLEVHQGCASGRGVLHRMLTALPNLSGIVTNLVKLYLFTDMVLPYMDDFPLPSVVKSPKGSFADLRVRAFDWQRAAKISGAPQREAPAKSSDESTGCRASVRVGEEKGGGAAGAPPSLLSSSSGYSAAASSFAFSRNTSSETVVADNSAALQAVGSDGGATSSSLRAGAGRRVSLFSLHDSSVNGGRVSGASYPNTPMSLSSSVAPTSPTTRAAAQAARNVAAVPPGWSAADSGGDQTRLPDKHSSKWMGSRSASISSNLMSAAVRDESQYGDSTAAMSESEEALSTASKKRSTTSGAMRNLKDWLKVKGKDMTRESVSRSKKKT
ncbi:hypothetical protein LSCM1_07892 [Leishmania martiniquensis]|uniref:SMP-LTD domain-containing protein n=1 Tax=Leishmania martiniquensis TaxID=1580590 RepID=A0A836HE62_9TRYP|nr:hypothetical protein LSCM1_07892 [Leishmania martiniquensis]